MTNLDPNVFRRDLNEVMARFVSTSSPINEIRAPGLARALRDRIQSIDFLKGPYLETLPDFEKGKSLLQLEASGHLHPTWLEMKNSAPALWKRTLHAHQEAAILRDSNYLVATGTGSGKTESFLYPLIDGILRQGNLDTPGVRAIIVYPLNALANDQLTRIARLLFNELGDPGITLGRYTGQVKSQSSREQEATRLRASPAFREIFGEDTDVPDNWRLSREDMRFRPPHIPITNYAMLEHILLLPTNRPLLRQASLSRIVLDEIHTYAGAQAIEVAFLLRRLKAHLGVADGIVRCVGTSASLDPARKGELANFASRLFGEPFTGEGSVITSERKRHPALARSSMPSGLGAADWCVASELSAGVGRAAEQGCKMSVEDWNFEARAEGLDALMLDEGAPSLGDALIAKLASFEEVQQIANRLEDGSVPMGDLAREVFPEAGVDALPALTGLVSVGVLAVSADEAVFPLLPARYHLISRAPDRVGATLQSGPAENIGRIVIGPEFDDEKRPAYELYVCRNCGEPYLEGWLGGVQISPLANTGERRLLRIVPGSMAAEEDGDVEEIVEGQIIHLDPMSGFVTEPGAPGAVALEDIPLDEDPEDGTHYLKRCVACNHRPSRFAEPVTTVRPGDEAMAAVAAQTLLEKLPEKGNGKAPPMNGRNLLVFSDNRQDAAFFAPFFERTSREQAVRAAILRNLARTGTCDFDNLVTAVLRDLQVDGLRLYRPGVEPQRETGPNERLRLKALLAAEITTLGRGRLSLEGFGLIGVDYGPIDEVVRRVARFLPEPLQIHAEAYTRYLLKMIREHRAICAKNSEMIDLTDESIWTRIAAQKDRCFLYERNSKATLALALKPATGRQNRFTNLLHKMAKEVGVEMEDTQVLDVLRGFWRAIEKDRDSSGLHGVGRGLSFGGALLIRPGAEIGLYQCRSCGARTQFDTAGVCQSMGCDGKLRAVTGEERETLAERNHYVARYNEHPRMGIAREHTAAIASEVRMDIEEAFKEGEVNLMSCTTTMEMGVDLGDLEAILNKNVPPSIANYQQRAGRAGRRAQVAPIALTTARSGRFDRSVFDDFRKYLGEKPRIPYLSLDNAGFFQRHQISTLLACFLDVRLANYGRTGSPRLRNVFGEALTEEARAEFDASFEVWITGAGPDIEDAAALRFRLPEAIRCISLDAPALKAEMRKRLGEFADAIWHRWRMMQDAILLKEEARKKLAPTDAKGFQKIDRILGALRSQQALYMNQFLIDQLSRRAVIPTYSFPVHSVSLDVLNTAKQTAETAILELDRDGSIGISEYAPGSEIVAGGRVWVSEGISKRSRFTGDDAFVERARYRVCDRCKSPQITLLGADPDEHCPQCGAEFGKVKRLRSFIRPHGFLTSVNEAQGRDPGASRIRPTVSDEGLLLTEAPRTAYQPTDLPGILTFHAPGSNRPDHELGRIITVNRGKHRGGFAWCRKCEHAVPVEGSGPERSWQQPVRLTKHDNPRTGEDCLFDRDLDICPVDLAHVFETDVRALLFEGKPRTPSGDHITMNASISHTLQEAIRLGAAELMETDARDIRALIQYLDGSLVIVLYDSVSGGAGYSTRLTQDEGFKAFDLLMAARRVLACRNPDCSTSCTACLNDYSNQRLWADFDRQPALAWVETILLDGGHRIDVPSAA